ncbi:MAG TPA: FAD-dependent oxidoreductase [bacterium]
MRIDRHPILSFNRGRAVEFTFDGRPIPAFESETIAAALHDAGIMVLSHSLRNRRPRGFFCAIGKCSSCMAEVNGVPNVKTCMVLVENGMAVRSQAGWGGLSPSDRRIAQPLQELPTIQADIAVVGAGPAGLSAAQAASEFGAEVAVFDENTQMGGQLVKQTHMFFGSKAQYASVRGVDIAPKLISHMGRGVKLYPETQVVGYYAPSQLAVVHRRKLHRVKAKKIIVATGASENMLAFPNNDLPGVYGAGAVQTLMNEYGILPGKRALMVGAGNIGVIVAYQMLQAGVEVAAVVEAAPKIGAYQVHASKIRRCGVPILTRHTVLEVRGKDRVECAVVVKVDECWEPVPGTETEYPVDMVCLSVGLRPTAELLDQMGCSMANIPELGGEVPFRNAWMETSVEGVYVAGDASGIDEASSAMLEGRLAGLDAVEKLKGPSEAVRTLKDETVRQLRELRAGPFGEDIRTGERKLAEQGEAG